MSYILPPQSTKNGSPTSSDDSSKGYVLGSVIVDTSVSPRVAYVCTNAAAGAATWANAGGVSAHPSLSTLGWSASGHTGTTNSVACFDGSGAAQTAQATVDGTVLTFSGGTLQFLAMAAAVAFTSARAVEIEYLTSALTPTTDAEVYTGSFV
jgi:hypothetical protein